MLRQLAFLILAACPNPRLACARLPRAPRLLLVLALAITSGSFAHAFSLLGPLDAYDNIAGGNWQVPAIGYNPRGFDIGNPMNLGEEYRYNTKVITYAFDESFLNYFGMQGVAAVEEAIDILRDLPRASDINLDDYPTDNRRFNDLAANLGIMDLKSQTLPLLLEVLGLAQPERWTWALRTRRTESVGGVTVTNYTIVQRNFDPVTLQPTNRVNDTLYQFIVFEFEDPDYADALEFFMGDPLQFDSTSVAGGILFPGQVFPGLTRDDAGGLRYLLRANNYNVEQLPTNTFPSTNILAALAGVTNVPPWTPLVVGTNFAFTNFATVPPWTPFIPGTNVVTNIFGTNLTNILIDVALRPGVEKIRFVRRNFDSLLGQQFRPYTNVYNDVVISNFSRVIQKVERVVTQPDLLFVVEDLGFTDDNDPSPIIVGRGVNFVNNDALNGNTVRGGPGVLQPPIVISYTDQLPVYREVASPTSEPVGPDPFDPFNPTSTLFFFSRSVIWGSFDATDTPPIIYPNSISLSDLEAAVRRGPN